MASEWTTWAAAVEVLNGVAETPASRAAQPQGLTGVEWGSAVRFSSAGSEVSATFNRSATPRALTVDTTLPPQCSDDDGCRTSMSLMLLYKLLVTVAALLTSTQFGSDLREAQGSFDRLHAALARPS